MALPELIIFAAILCICLTIFSYIIPNKYGYRKIGIVLSSIVGLFFFFVAISIIFEDELFSKSDAIELLQNQNVSLNRDFKILKNESMFSIGDYRHDFILEISIKDKQDIIAKIKSSDNFKSIGDSVAPITALTDWQLGKMVIQNYETKDQFVRKLFKPIGEGYSPTYQVIMIEKDNTILKFEER